MKKSASGPTMLLSLPQKFTGESSYSPGKHHHFYHQKHHQKFKFFPSLRPKKPECPSAILAPCPLWWPWSSELLWWRTSSPETVLFFHGVSHQIWRFQDPIDGGTLVPYLRPYFGRSPYIGLKNRPFFYGRFLKSH